MSVLHSQHFPIAEGFFPPNCHSAKLGFCIVLIRELTSHMPNSRSLRGSPRAGLCRLSETPGCYCLRLSDKIPEILEGSGLAHRAGQVGTPAGPDPRDCPLTFPETH